MINYLKQFGAWVTGFDRDVFFKTRLKIISSFVLAISLLLLLFNIALYAIRGYYLPEILSDYISSKEFLGEAVRRITDTMIFNSVILSILVITATLVIGYFFANISLRSLKQAMQTQKRFIADASHELRTPLSIMKTNSEVALLEGQELSVKDALGTLKSNLEEIDRMSNILQNLLNLTQIAKTVEIPFARVNLSDVVMHCLQTVDRIASRKSIKLSVSKADSAMIWGNVTALEEMTLNLLKNAVFYTPDEGQVSVTVKNNPTQNVELVIKDTGIGIPPRDLPHIFEPFFKTEASRSRKAGEGSSGLGLTIVREIVKKHSGSISVKSLVGKGTTITVSFPATRAIQIPQV